MPSVKFIYFSGTLTNFYIFNEKAILTEHISFSENVFALNFY